MPPDPQALVGAIDRMRAHGGGFQQQQARQAAFQDARLAGADRSRPAGVGDPRARQAAWVNNHQQPPQRSVADIMRMREMFLQGGN